MSDMRTLYDKIWDDHLVDEAADGIVFRRIHVPVKQVGNTRHLGNFGTGGDDRQIAIDLHGIGVDHDAADAFGNGERQCRLAARGRPCDKHRGLASQVFCQVKGHVICHRLLHTILCPFHTQPA